MSYDIELVNKVTGETAKMKHPQYVRGGTVPARVNPVTKELEQAEQVEAHINITYNYSYYYYEATDGDIRFDGRATVKSLPGVKRNASVSISSTPSDKSR